MKNEQNITGIFGGYIALVNLIGAFFIALFIFLFTGINYYKRGQNRLLNLFFGSR